MLRGVGVAGPTFATLPTQNSVCILEYLGIIAGVATLTLLSGFAQLLFVNLFDLPLQVAVQFSGVRYPDAHFVTVIVDDGDGAPLVMAQPIAERGSVDIPAPPGDLVKRVV